ncbi:MAG TPA: NlpC/P60 family protein [Mycobacteriales bacterium]|nr:NlpC/P60 family protein [Mycobacteriales bacterium]
MGRRVAWAVALSPVVAVLALLVVGAVSILGGAANGGQIPIGGVSGGQLRDGNPRIPAKIVALVRGALIEEGCPQLTESVLAAQLFAESGFNANAVSATNAQGIAQFEPGTWPHWGRDEDGDGVASPFDPADAVPAAARFDCALARQFASIPGDPAALMLAGYNAGPVAVEAAGGIPPFQETQHYVRTVLALAATWAVTPSLVGAGHGDVPPGASVQLTGDPRIDTAVAWAVGQIGSMYHFGGDCTDPFGPDIAHHCDCSSLMQQAYSHAGVVLPRTAAAQSRQGDAVAESGIRPGDLVATVGADGTRSAPGHIGMYVGGGNVVEAPFEGRPVHLFPLSAYHDIVTIRRIVIG